MTISGKSTVRFIGLRWLHMLLMTALLSAGGAATMHAPAMAAVDDVRVAAAVGAQGDCLLPCDEGHKGRSAGQQGCDTSDCATPAILDTESLSVSGFATTCNAAAVVSLHSEERALETPPPIL